MHVSRRNKRGLFGQKGVELTEFALSLPFVLLIGGALTIDLGHIINIQTRLNAATREAAILATETVGVPSSLQPAVYDRIQRVLTDSGIPYWDPKLTVSANYFCPKFNGTEWRFMSANAQYSKPQTFFGGILKFFRINALDNLTLSSTSTAYMQDGGSPACTPGGGEI